ncbi:MAG: NUDIX hydrolase [bacterium]|nr:NUDIX hydrolase [Acidimicrobiia bacterium]MCY4650555.1 NUDIX hydrolase [bacterium]
MSFRLLGVRTVGRGRILDYQRLHLLAGDGTAVVRDVIRHRGGVGILPVWGEEITLIRQYRAAVEEDVLEIPAGKIEEDEASLLDAARRELWEETGLSAKRITDLGEILPSPGYTDERIRLFAAEGLTQGERSPDGVEERFAQVVRVGVDEALGMIESGKIRDAKTVVALLRWVGRTKERG